MMLETRIQDHVAMIRMTHGKANALDSEFCEAIALTFESLDETVRGVVLTGEGKIFSAGVDLLRMSEESEAYTRGFLPLFHRAILALFTCPVPVVAAINGHAIAGGCLVACTADYRVMAHGPFKIGVPELKVGVPFPPAALEVLRFTAPERYMQELASGERIYNPAEALSCGLIHKVVAPDDLVEVATGEAQRLASLHKAAFSLTKSMLRRPVVDQIAYLNDIYGHQIEADWLADDTRAAIKDYVQQTLKRG